MNSMKADIVYRFVNALLTVTSKVVIILSCIIPVVFIILMFLHNYIEQHFRSSLKYRYIYSYGGLLCACIQYELILISFLLILNIVFNSRKYNVWTNVIATFLGGSVFIYIYLGLAWALLIRTN